MNTIIFLILRRMRTPLLVLLTVYALAIVGMTMMPGLDDQGNPWQMNFFEAFYFVSYMGTTIGFGDLIQDDALRKAIVESRFARTVSNINEPFYLICGYGDTGSALVTALEKRLMRSTVIEIKQERINTLILENYPVYVPKLCADASQPLHLVKGGLKNPYCAGVVAITDDSLVNLHIAITSKLLKSELTVIGRVDSQDVAANMDSFGTDFIINPFKIFASKLHTALYSPNLLLLRDCLSGYKTSCQPLEPPESGLWILCGYGRFGKAVYERLKEKKDLHLVVIEAVPKKTGYPPVECIEGRGTEADTLLQAHIDKAVGLIAGTDDDVNNLSIVMTARDLNPKLFILLIIFECY